MKQARTEGREIFYLDESWVDTNLTFQKCWQKKGEVEGVMSTGSAANRLIIFNTFFEERLPSRLFFNVRTKQARQQAIISGR
jgi:hypothetical protein